MANRWANEIAMFLAVVYSTFVLWVTQFNLLLYLIGMGIGALLCCLALYILDRMDSSNGG
jgi:Flp pilus assembly protein protease CpaA